MTSRQMWRKYLSQSGSRLFRAGRNNLSGKSVIQYADQALAPEWKLRIYLFDECVILST